MLRELVNFYRKFEDIFLKLQGSNYVTLYYVYSSIHFLKNFCQFVPEDSEPIRSLKTHILNGINDVWIPNLDMIHKVGLFLFPPTNQLKMFSQDEISEIHNFCIEETMLCNNESDSIEETSHQHQITDDCLFSGLINESNNTTFEEKIKKEISKYSNLIVDYEQQFDVLNWLNNHQSEFKNLYKLMDGIWLFLKEHITTGDYNIAKMKLSKFCIEFETLYKVENMFYNVHLIQHLAESVKNCGPLWAYSNFNFEDNNGVLVSYVNGTSDVEKQVVSKYLYTKLNNQNPKGAVLSYMEYISTINKVKTVKRIDNVTLLNKPICYRLSDDEKFLLREQFSCDFEKVNTYNKFILSNDIYYSSSYKRAKKTNDCCIKLIDGRYGQINLIFDFENIIYLIITIYESVVNRIEIDKNSLLHIVNISSTTKKCVPISNVLKKCIFLSTNNICVISEFPNRIECD